MLVLACLLTDDEDEDENEEDFLVRRLFLGNSVRRVAVEGLGAFH